MNEQNQQEQVGEVKESSAHPYYHEVPSGNGYRDEQLTKYLTPLAIIVGALIISATLIFTRTPSGNSTSIPGTVESTTTEVSINDVNVTDSPYIGNKDAPVTIALWTDYQCPFCKQLETQTLPSVISNYVNDGKVRIVFKDFQFLGPDSTVAALVARSVWKLYPQNFFAWREAMYNAQDQENSGFGDKASVLALTKTISGIDAQKVDQDITDHQAEYQQAIDADRTEGTKFGIQGTPALLIGDQIIPGALAYSDIKPLIEAQLK